jgi:hypothetical protein
MLFSTCKHPGMQIIIQISDSTFTAASTTISATSDPLSTVVSLNNVNDGGAPNIAAANNDNSNVSVVDQINVGGPPVWLIEAFDKDNNSANDTAFETNAAADGGAAPSF